MVLSDFLSRQQGDNSHPHQIIPISFNMKQILRKNYQNVVKYTFMVQTRSQIKAKGVREPAVQSTAKSSDKRGRRREVKPIVIDNTPIVIHLDTKLDLDTQVQNAIVTQQYNPTRPGVRQTPAYSHPRLPLRPPDLADRRSYRTDIGTDPNLDFEENLPHQEGIVTEIYESPDQSYIEEPHQLTNLVNTSKLIQKYLPKQTDIDKILDIIKRKVLKGTHLPLTIKEIQAGYLTSAYLKGIHQYLVQNELPSKRNAMHKVEFLSERFILLDSLLFKLITALDKEKALLAIPEACTDKIIELYHASLFAGHQGVINTFLTISDKFFIPNLMHCLRLFLKACHICQLSRNDKPPSRQLQTRINLNYKSLSILSMDLKVMPRSQKGCLYILCIIDEVTNYLVTAPLYQARSEEVGEALIEKCHKYIWHTRVYNDAPGQHVHVLHNPFELIFGRKPKILLNVETDPDVKVSGTYKDYHTLLTKRLQYLQNMLQNFKMKHLALINKDREYFLYKSGDLVYLISPLTTQLRTSSRKVAIKYIGPLVIYKIVDPHNYLFMTIDGKLLRGLFEHKRLKPIIIKTDKGNVTLSALKRVMNLEISL